MRGVELQQVSDETLKICRRRAPVAAIVPLLAMATWIAAIFAVGPFYGMILLGVGLGTLPWVLPLINRAIRPFEVTLTRSAQSVSLDQQPLEAARVETRVLSTWITRSPCGYSLSLWVLYVEGGNADVGLGRFRSLLEASQAAGTIEAFLANASITSSSPALTP